MWFLPDIFLVDDQSAFILSIPENWEGFYFFQLNIIHFIFYQKVPVPGMSRFNKLLLIFSFSFIAKQPGKAQSQ